VKRLNYGPQAEEELDSEQQSVGISLEHGVRVYFLVNVNCGNTRCVCLC
jgi:hypothetical protein